MPRIASIKRKLKQWLVRRRAKRGIALRALTAEFSREVRAVGAGMQKYREAHAGTTGNRTLLRRNIHRLEKALTMRPRRAVFALDFIAETTDAFAKLVKYLSRLQTLPTDDGPAPRGLSLDVEYAHAVLKMYFDMVDEAPEVLGPKSQFHLASELFLALSGEVQGQSHDRHVVPYQRPVQVPTAGLQSLKDLAFHRRSIRWFESKPVPRALIDEAISVGIQAPSACNRQPFRFIVLDDPDAIAKVASIPMGTKGYQHQIPVFIVVIGQQRHFHDARDRHVIYIDASLATMGLLLAVEAMGLGACCINWPDIEAKEKLMQQHLGLEDDERPIMCLAMGWPLEEALVASSPKKEVSELRTYNPHLAVAAIHRTKAA